MKENFQDIILIVENKDKFTIYAEACSKVEEFQFVYRIYSSPID